MKLNMNLCKRGNRAKQSYCDKPLKDITCEKYLVQYTLYLRSLHMVRKDK